MLHIIFQRHHIPPDEFLGKPKWVQAFLLESMKVQIKAERKARDKNYVDDDGEEV